ncbi:hypothetical protein [Brevundimonas sp.]|uniref:hypothetical protein n=1 Tax=Brevundimonas sp. TaxID=1871086 RepID=UPI00289E3463|nr:hypothetical protein [Brevundimonas sp.]
MAITLPTSPRPSKMVPRPIFTRNETRPATGAGPVGRNLRPGTRWAWDFEYPPMTYEQSLAFDDLLTEDETVIVDILQPGLAIGSPGSGATVNGAGQSGRTLNIKGVAAGYVFRKGQWISVLSGGQWYAYKTRAAATADGAGNCAVPLRTLIRTPLANNAVVEIASPKAEGWVTLAEDAHEIDAVDRLIWLRFTLEERD